MSQRRPLNILFASPVLTDLIIKTKDQGHSISIIDLSEYDVVFGPNCCRMVPELEGHADVTIQEVQRGKYVRTPKKTGRGVRSSNARPKQ